MRGLKSGYEHHRGGRDAGAPRFEEGRVMRGVRCVVAVVAALLPATLVHAEPVSQSFKRVKDSIVVIRTAQTELSQVPGREATSIGGLGSGVLIDRLGTVLTAAHVVQVADEIQVEFTSGEVIPARVQASVPAVDLAVLRLERPPTEAVAVPLGDSDLVEVGDQIFIVGAPLGISHTLTVGHISARRVTDKLFGGLLEAEMFQTDAAINVGNSGGPMFNMAGEVVGIVSHMISMSGSYEGLGFAMTSKLVRNSVLKRGSVWSGFEGYVLSGELARIFNLPQERGILVQRVAKGSPASRMGLQPGTVRAEIEGEPILLGGDIILDIEGVRLSDPDATTHIKGLLSTVTPGAEVRLTVLRRGKRVGLSSVLVPR
jgi:S1-C subfamily serine protease